MDRRTRLTTMTALAILAATPATAGDVQGDAYGCQELWVMRNQIFKDNGYCFATDRARDYFGNGGCRYHSESSVPLSKQERNTVRQIRASERRQSCR